MRIQIEIPDEVFDKPQFQASIKVPKDAVSAPVISAEIVDNVEEIIKQQTGFEVKLNLIEPEEKDGDA